jgi:ATP-dependent Clp protease ATP-binding subunit ClpA
MNRLDRVVVFHPLKRAELDEVLEIELRQVQKRVLDSTTRPFFFRITNEGREFLLEEGTDQRYGARHLKRAIERNVVCPLSRLLASCTRAICCSSIGNVATKGSFSLKTQKSDLQVQGLIFPSRARES